MADEWLTEDLPILHAVRQLEDENDPGATFRVQDIAPVAGVEDQSRVVKLLVRLARADYLDGDPLETMSGVHDVFVQGLTERGRRAVGQWPSQDPWAGLVELLSQQIDQEPDEDKRTRLIKVRDGVLSAGRGIGVTLLTKYLEQQAGLA